MNKREPIKNLIEESINAKKLLLNDELIDGIIRISDTIIEALKSGHKLLIAGNGGSAADAQHMAAELVGRFYKERRGYAAIALTVDSSILTAIANDYSYDNIFARQIDALGQEGDIFIGISTSGNSKNIIEAVYESKRKHLKTIVLTGNNGGELIEISDYSFIIPSFITPRIQESHILIIHIICEIVENTLANY